MTAGKKKVVMPVMAACQNQNFGRPVTHHTACHIERNGTVPLLLFPSISLTLP
jgi:hypothetical protein